MLDQDTASVEGSQGAKIAGHDEQSFVPRLVAVFYNEKYLSLHRPTKTFQRLLAFHQHLRASFEACYRGALGPSGYVETHSLGFGQLRLPV